MGLIKFIIIIPLAIICLILVVVIPYQFIISFFSAFFALFKRKKYKVETLLLAKYVFYFSSSGFLMYITGLSGDYITNQKGLFHDFFKKANVFFHEKNYMMFFFQKPKDHLYLGYFINIFHPLMFVIFIISSGFGGRNKKVGVFYNSEVIPSKAYEWYDLSKNEFIKYFLKNSKFHNRDNKTTYTKSEKYKTKEERMGESSENKHEKFLLKTGDKFNKQFFMETSAFYGNADFVNLKRFIIQEIKSTNAIEKTIEKYKIPEGEKQLKTYLFMSKFKKEKTTPGFEKGELVIFKMKNKRSNVPMFLKKKNVELSSVDFKKLFQKEITIREIKERAIILKSTKKALESLGL